MTQAPSVSDFVNGGISTVFKPLRRLLASEQTATLLDTSQALLLGPVSGHFPQASTQYPTKHGAEANFFL